MNPGSDDDESHITHLAHSSKMIINARRASRRHDAMQISSLLAFPAFRNMAALESAIVTNSDVGVTSVGRCMSTWIMC